MEACVKKKKERREYPEIAPAGPTYARAVRSGHMLFISGCTARGTDAEGGAAIDQLRVTLDRVVRIVRAEGGTPSDIVKLTTYVTRMGDWSPASEEQQAIFDSHFEGENPANSLIGVTALALPGLDIEIEAVAIID